MTRSFYPPVRTLMGPGPSDVSPRVLSALARPTIGHLDPLFVDLMDEIKALLQYAFQTSNELTLPVSAPGSAGMEACFVNLVSPGDTVIVCQNGVFGGRMKENVERCGATAIMVEDHWGEPVSLDKVAAAFHSHPQANLLAFVHAETSTGVRYPVKEVSSIVKNYPNTICVIDGITGVGVFELPMDEWGIDILVAGSQKAFMLPPGLAFAGVSDKAWEMNKTSKMPRFYFNWTKELTNLKKNQTNFTPAISLIVGLRESLRMMREDGLEKIYKRAEILARATREGAIALGLQPFAKNPSPAVTAIYAPEGIDGQAIYKSLWKKYGVTGAGGQDHLKGKIFRIATLGYADKYDVVTAIAALEFTLKDLGHKFQMGAGVGRALEILQEL